MRRDAAGLLFLEPTTSGDDLAFPTARRETRAPELLADSLAFGNVRGGLLAITETDLLSIGASAFGDGAGRGARRDESADEKHDE